MPTPIRGLSQSPPLPAADLIEEPVLFVTEVEDGNCIAYKGQRIEYFTTFESPASVAAGERVFVMYVPFSQQCVIIGKLQ